MKEVIRFDKVADIYDDYVKVDFDIPFFLKETEWCEEKILELMCGTGRVSIPLLQSGKNLVCVDYSQGMLDRLSEKIRGKGYKATLIHMDVTELNLDEKFRMILLPFHSLSEILTYDMQLKALNSIHAHLKDDGFFICTLQNPEVRLQNADGERKKIGSFSMENGRTLTISFMNKKDEDNVVTGFQWYEIFDSSGTLIEERSLEINFRLIDKKDFEEMAEKSGFFVDALYGDYNYGHFKPNENRFMIYILGKNKT